MGEEKLLRLANPFLGNNNIKLEKLAGAGSNRVYYRIKDNVSERTIVGVVGTDEKENRAFIYFSEVFRRNGLCVPEVYAVSDDGLVYLQEDLASQGVLIHFDDNDADACYEDEHESNDSCVDE